MGIDELSRTSISHYTSNAYSSAVLPSSEYFDASELAKVMPVQDLQLCSA